MKITKSGYEAIGAAIKKTEMNWEVRSRLVESLSEVFAEHNPAFNRRRFAFDCGVFPCGDCDLIFPTRSAYLLHNLSNHVEMESTNNGNCN